MVISNTDLSINGTISTVSVSDLCNWTVGVIECTEIGQKYIEIIAVMYET